MSIHPELVKLAGKWKGNNRLYASFLPEPIKDSPTLASIDLRVNGQFLALEYDWAFEGERQEGVLILGCDSRSDAVQAVWTDSWHMSHKFMVCDGNVAGDGSVDMKGFYAVPEHPDWGWRTEIIPGDDSFRLLMYNISPEGEEELAVEADYSRA